jgi:hypothetical protein
VKCDNDEWSFGWSGLVDGLLMLADGGHDWFFIGHG